MADEPAGQTDSEEPIRISAVITQQDMDERIKRLMRENSVAWLTNLHTFAVQGKTWLLAEPDKAAMFLDVARKTTQYRPGKLYFEQLDIDDEIIDLKPPSDASVKDVNQFRGSTGEIFGSFNPMMQTLFPLLGTFGVLPPEFDDIYRKFK